MRLKPGGSLFFKYKNKQYHHEANFKRKHKSEANYDLSDEQLNIEWI